MPALHRHNEFIWALLLSLILNLLFITTLIFQRSEKRLPRLQPFNVSIESRSGALPDKISSAAPAIKVTSPEEKTNEPPLPAELHERSVNAELPRIPAAPSGVGTASPLPSPEGANIAGAATENRSEMSIWGDKSTEDDYTAPEYLAGDKPPYPKRAARNGWEGTVLLNLQINANGEVEQVEIAESSGYDILDHQARATVRNWHFKPARHHGSSIAVTVQQPIIFRSPVRGRSQ